MDTIKSNASDLKIVFAGTPEFAATHLAELLAHHFSIIGVFTQPDRPAGRGKKLTPSAVKSLALEHNLPVFQPENFKSEESINLLKSLKPDVMIVVAYGLILPQAVLDIPKYGCFNVHGSLLPRWRGAAPIQRACWAGDKETGITIMQMDVGLDSGDMLYKMACPIEKDDTSETLYKKLAKLGPQALIKTLDDLSNNQLSPQKQCNELVTYATKLSKEEAKLNWQLSAEELERSIRAFNPWPVCYFEIQNETIKVWHASILTKPSNQTYIPGSIIKADKNGIQIMTSTNILNITELQPSGKKRMSAADLLNSKKSWFSEGTILS